MGFVNKNARAAIRTDLVNVESSTAVHEEPGVVSQLVGPPPLQPSRTL